MPCITTPSSLARVAVPSSRNSGDVLRDGDSGGEPGTRGGCGLAGGPGHESASGEPGAGTTLRSAKKEAPEPDQDQQPVTAP
jgi:hypothetical protein